MNGKAYEGWAFTLCKAAFLVLLCRLLGWEPLFVLSAAAAALYLIAQAKGVKTWRCWVKPPYVTVFWLAVALFEAWRLWGREWISR